MSKPGRNDRCPCGSGKKYKHCCEGRTAASPAAHSTSQEAPPTSVVAKHAILGDGGAAIFGAKPVGPAPSAPLVSILRRAPDGAAARRRQTLTRPGAKKLVLVYPPYSAVTAAPLGVAYLKGFVQRSLPDWSVKVLDTNLEAHQDFLARVGRGDWPGPLELPAGAGRETLLRAAETFRGQHPEEFYDRIDLMVRYSQVWQRAVRAALYQPAIWVKAFMGAAALPELFERHAEHVLRERPTVVGISICYSEQYWAGLCLARAIKQRADVPILLGGTMFKEGIEADWVTDRWPVDYVVSGAGEQPIVEILAGRADGGRVPGVTLIENGRMESTPPFYDNDFNAVGDPDFSDLDLHGYYSPQPILPLQTSRGCYWKKCTFCNHYKTVGETYQQRSMENIVAELSRHAANGIRHFHLVDDIVSPARFSNLSKAILEAGLSVRYHAMARPMKQFTAEVFDRMYKSGCRFVLWGVESGSQRVLDTMDKGTVVADVEQVMATGKLSGVRNHVFIICGFPTETREEFMETVAFLARAKANIHCVNKTMYELERGTPVFDNPERFGITRIWPKRTALLYDFDCTEGMTRLEARQALNEARPFFRSFASNVALEQGDFRFRDHLLMMYCRDDDRPRERGVNEALGAEALAVHALGG